LRADAARNAERIMRVAREVFAELGPDAQLEEIARRADVRIRTLYNHFPHKVDLVRAALEQSLAERLAPAVDRALADDDPLTGLVSLIEAAMSMAAHELNVVAAARVTGILSPEIYPPFENALTLLARRAQEAGLLRADLVPDDLSRLMAMLISTLWTMDPVTGGWRRYLALMVEGLAPAAAKTLPPPVALITEQRTGSWPF
jgi:AcrR family transcriptional regulator